MVTIRGRIMVGYLRKIGKDTGRAREIPAAGWREHTSNGEQRQSAGSQGEPANRISPRPPRLRVSLPEDSRGGAEDAEKGFVFPGNLVSEAPCLYTVIVT